MKSPSLPTGTFTPNAIILIILSILGFGLGACSNLPATNADPPETITFGDLNVESSAFVYIAEEQGFFKNNGLNVIIKPYETGPAVVDALMKNDVEMVTSGEFPFVIHVLEKGQLTALTSMDKFQAFYLICRKDRGIADVADIKGKTVGLVSGALPEFYLGRFLDLRGMNIQAVTVVNVKPAQWVDAISNGDVDAIVVSQASVSQIQARLKDKILIWPVQSNQDAFGLVYSRSDWVNQHPDLVRRFLLALSQAEDYVATSPSEARAILKKRLNLDDAYLESAWPQHNFSLSLDQSLVVAMEDETRWLIDNRLTSATQVPDFTRYIYENGLDAVEPEAVNIIR